MKMKLLMLGFAMVILYSLIVTAATVEVQLDNDGTIAMGIQIINATITGSTGNGTNVTNATFYYRAIDETTWTQIGINTTYNLSIYGIKWNTSELRDDTVYILNVTVVNYSRYANSDISGNIDIDNTVPICSQSTLSSNSKADTAITRTVTVTATNSTGCSVHFGSNYYSFSESSDTCTFDMTQVPDLIYGTVTFQTADKFNTTSCAEITSLDVDNGGGSSNMFKTFAQTESSSTQPGTTGSNVRLLLIVIVVIIIVWYLTKKK